MKFFIVLSAAVAIAAGAIVPDYPPADNYGASAGSDYGSSGDGYGKPKCRDYFETQTREHCESYTDKVCTTTQKETCTDEADQNCRGVVTAKQQRKCFDVTEQKCSLKEDIKLKTIQVPVAIQKCSKAFETVCDTTYDSVASSKSRQQCITVNNPKCSSVQQTVHDRTCRTTTTFDCDTSYGGDAYGAGSGSGNAYGADNSAYGQADAYGSEQGYGAGDNQGYSSTSAYGQPKPNCRRSQDTKCYNTPRTVSVPQCSTVASQVCESLVERIPQVKPRQSCRKEEKRVCQLIERTQPKQIKEYSYSKQCRSVPRQVCGDADQKSLVPSCVPTTRKRCAYHPVENCEEIPKNKCFQIAFKVRKQKCDSYSDAGYGGQAQQQQQGYSDGGDGY